MTEPRTGRFTPDPRGGVWTDTNVYIEVQATGVMIRHPARRHSDDTPVEWIAREERVHSSGWVAEAACTGLPAVLFFPPRGAETAIAKAICYQCPVRQDCLDDANGKTRGGSREKHGVWGGLSERQRRNHQHPDRWLDKMKDTG